MTIVVIAVCFVALVAAVYAFVASRRRYYDRMFSEENFRVVHSGLSRAIEVARKKNADVPPSDDDGTAFVSDAGLAVGVTWSNDDAGSCTLHISMSQAGQITTDAVCSRFGFFIVAMLSGNTAELAPFSTESGVHHFVYRLQSGDVSVKEFDTAYSAYVADYKRIPFERRKIGTTGHSAA